MEEKIITKQYLWEHPNEVFVFGDNTIRHGFGGAAELRDSPNVYGFITKKYPSNHIESYYIPPEYKLVYEKEIALLIAEITENPTKRYLISKLGAGLANRYKIFEKVIEPRLKKDLAGYSNVEFLW